MAWVFRIPARLGLVSALLIGLGYSHAGLAANTSQSVATAFKSLTWEQVKFVIDRDPGMKASYDGASPALQGMMQANPAGVPWDTITKNRDQATLDRIAGLIAQAKQGAAPAPVGDPRITVLDPAFYVGKYPDLRKAFGSNMQAAQRHWIDYGIKEGRQSSATFDLRSYLGRYPDLQKAFGSDFGAALNHWFQYGQREGRSAVPMGLLTKGSTPAVYLIDMAGAKRPIASPEVFNGCGLNWGAILTLPDPQLNAVPTGPMLSTAPACQAVKSGKPEAVAQTPPPPTQQPQPAQAAQAPNIDLTSRVPEACNILLKAAVDDYKLEPTGVAGVFMRMNKVQMAEVLELVKHLYWTPKAMQKVLQNKLHDLEPETRCAAMIDVAKQERGSYPGAELNRLLPVIAQYNASKLGTPVVGNEIKAVRAYDGAPQSCMITPATTPAAKAGQCHQLSMSAVNLSGRDLTRMYFTSSNMARANFTGAKMSLTVFNGSDLTGADFSNTDLTGANLVGAKLDGAKFTGAKLSRVKGYPGTPAGHVCSSDSVNTCRPVREINGCVIEPGVFMQRPGNDCSNLDLRNADLRNLDLTMMKLERANLAGADLSGAKLIGTYLLNANLQGAKIGGARFDGANLSHATWTDGKFCSKTSDKGQCQPIARVNDCWIERDSDCRAVGGLADANFSGLDLTGVNLEGADLSRANFSNADLSGANLFKAKLDRAIFLGAKVRADGTACSRTQLLDTTRGATGGPVCVLGDGSQVTVGVDVANGSKREATVVSAPLGGRVVYVHNLCQDSKTISIKNSLSIASGDYLDIAGPGQKDLLIPSGGEVKLPAPGKQHRVHFQGNYLAGIDLKSDSDHVYIKPGSCDMVVGNPATIGSQLATTQRSQVVTIVNQCVQPESLAIKNDETGEYQKIGADTKTPTDRKVAVNGADMVSLYGSKFWVHFSGLVVAGMKFEGSGQIIIEKGGSPCKLRFVQGQSPVEGKFRITRLRDTNDRAIAQNYARMVEAATYGRATPEEMVQINDFLAYASKARVQAADIALAGLKGWREMTKEHNPRCVERKATALQPRDYTPQQAAAEGFTIPLTFDGKEKFCRFEPRYTVTTEGKPANVNLGMLFNANNEAGEITPPDDYLNMAMAGVPIRTMADGEALNKALASAGGAIGALAVGGALATAATVGPAAVAIATGIAPFALHGVAVGTAAEAAIAGGIAASAFAAPAIAASVVIAIAAPMLMDIIKNLEYEPKIQELRRSYVAVSYTLEALRSSDGRYALFTHYTRYAKNL